MGDGYLSGLKGAVLDGLEAQKRRDRYKDDPGLWAADMLGVQFWRRQQDIGLSVRDHRRTAVAAGHGVGKTWSASIIAAWWIDTHPHNGDDTFVATTAPTMDQVSLIWDGIRRVYTQMMERHKEYRRRNEAGLPLGEYAACDHMPVGYVTGDNKIKLKNGDTLGQGRKPPDQKADVAFQGRHATYLLAIIDEAVGVSDDFFTAVSSIATGRHNRQLVLANPTDPNSAMAKLWNKSKSKKDKGATEEWNLMHISVLDSPLITGEDGFDISKAEGLSGWEYVNERREDWGEDDPRYISRVMGQWAFDSGNTVFADVDIARAINTCVIVDPDSRPQQGWDIARMGADATVGYEARWGEVWTTDEDTGKPLEPTGRRGLHIRKLDTWRKAPLVGEDEENPGTATRIHRHMLADGAGVAAIDASGMGGAVIDGLNEIARKNHGRPYEVVEVFGGAAPSDKREYINMRAEQYFELKRRFFAWEIDVDGADEELLEELRGVVFEYATAGAKKIESKDDMKRKGKKSPDHADAFWYTAMDVSALIDDPLAGMKKGDMLFHDPAEMLEANRNSFEMPWEGNNLSLSPF